MNRTLKFIFLAPVVIYALFLILFPIIYILILSFQTSDNYGGIIYTFTIYNYIRIFDPVYLKVFFNSAIIGIFVTLACLLIAYPFSIFVSEKKPHIQKLLITLVLVPFLTNSLIRTYGWIVLLRKEGIFNTISEPFGICNSTNKSCKASLNKSKSAISLLLISYSKGLSPYLRTVLLAKSIWATSSPTSGVTDTPTTILFLNKSMSVSSYFFLLYNKT